MKKILFVEDTFLWVQEFKPILETFGDITHFKSYQATIQELDKTLFDLVVSDHNILLWENESRTATATDIYFELRCLSKTTPFIHFSVDPCPNLYLDSSICSDSNFYSIKKEYGADLFNLVKKIMK